jgi:hypothetical protein
VKRTTSVASTAVASIVASIAASIVGCAEVNRALVSTGEYDAYRNFRLADDADTNKLRIASTYLHDHPKGAFHDEIDRWFTPHEEAFFEKNGRTPNGATLYLDTLPEGPHAAEVEKWLAEYRRETIEAPLKEKAALEAARKKADEARKASGAAIEAWTRRAIALTTWAAPLAQVLATDKAFGDALHEDPAASCDAQTCKKILYFKYPVPDAQPPADRIVPIVIKVDASEDHLSSVTMVAPKGGFTWWMEGAEARGVDDQDPNERAQAIVRAKNRVETVVRDAVGPSVSCSTTEEPTMRTIDCGKIRVIVAAEPTGDDTVRVIGGL